MHDHAPEPTPVSRKRKRGRSTKHTSRTPDASGSNAEATAAEPGRKLRRSERIREQRSARKRTTDDRDKGIRPWILPGFAGIAVIAIVLIGVSALGSDNGADSEAARVPSPSLGDRTAQVVIHEYGDYQCPFCGVFARSIKPELQARFIDTGIARLVWHDFAWHGTESLTSANAARCAGDQGQFWEFHDTLFELFSGENNGTFSNDNLKRYGDALGLDPETFHECVENDTYGPAISADMGRVRRLGLNGTPSFIIGDQRIVGAQPVEVFEQAIRAELRAQG